VAAGRCDWAGNSPIPVYGWDNEYGLHHADVPAFEAARYLTSNGEFREFVEAGGYSRPEFWDRGRPGLAAASPPARTPPSGCGWRDWKLRLMAEEVPMPWDWPVEVNCLEARAFCRWKAAKTGLPVRLPTEDEWRRLYDVCGLSRCPG
jgi:formylglycine-generating enzyme required for sulfatase activity